MDVAGIGTPYFDQLCSIDVLPKTDASVHTLESSWQYGGKVSTALAALARLGHTGAIHANVGGIFGKCIRLDFLRHGVDCTHLKDVPGTQSNVCICLAEKSTGGRSFVGFRNPAGVPEITAGELDKTALLTAGWLLVENLRETSALAASWFREAGKQVVVDSDSLLPETIENMPLVDHFLASQYTYSSLYGDDENYENNLRALRAMQKNERAVTVVTLGANGLAGIDEAGRYFRQSAYKVDVVDTTGAGDVFHGAYIAGRLDGLDAEGACRYAQAAAAVKCTRLGGRAGIPTRGQLAEFMETGNTRFMEHDERAAYYCEPPFERAMGQT